MTRLTDTRRTNAERWAQLEGCEVLTCPGGGQQMHCCGKTSKRALWRDFVARPKTNDRFRLEPFNGRTLACPQCAHCFTVDDAYAWARLVEATLGLPTPPVLELRVQ